MPLRTRTSQFVVVEDQEGGKSLKITLELELNINLNSNGLQATVAAKAVEAEPDGEDVIYAIPDFGNSQKIDFGKKVEETKNAPLVEDDFDNAVKLALSKRKTQ